VLSDQLGRFASRDFTSSLVSNGVFRLLIAVPFGYSIQSFANKDFGIPPAFLIGAFPTNSLFTIARRLVGQKLNLGEEAADGKLQLGSQQDITCTNAERFLDEGSPPLPNWPGSTPSTCPSAPIETSTTLSTA
jgi:hypothetical protein